MRLSELKKLDEAIYDEAIQNIKEQKGADAVEFMTGADTKIIGCFSFSESPQGFDYWQKVHDGKIQKAKKINVKK